MCVVRKCNRTSPLCIVLNTVVQTSSADANFHCCYCFRNSATVPTESLLPLQKVRKKRFERYTLQKRIFGTRPADNAGLQRTIEIERRESATANRLLLLLLHQIFCCCIKSAAAAASNLLLLLLHQICCC